MASLSRAAPAEPLAVLVRQLVNAVPAAQRRLDEAHAESLRQFVPVLRWARERGWGDLVAPFAPPALVATETTVECRFRVARQLGSGLSVTVWPLNAAFQRKYQHAEASEQRIEVTVRRAPLPPGPDGA